jgi:tetratricopeptide (TPR) repeat protein
MDPAPGPQDQFLAAPKSSPGIPQGGEMRPGIQKLLRAQRLLPATLAILVATPLTLHAQSSASDPPSDTPPRPTPPEIQAQVTPEDVGDSLLVHHRYQEALEQYRKASSDSSDVWDKMGIAYQMLSNLKDATRCYKQSLRLKPTNDLPLNNLATIYELHGQYSRAEAMYRRALELNPTSAEIAMNLGTILIVESKYSEGSAFYKRALALDPEVFDQPEGPVFESNIPVQQRGAMNYYKAQHFAQLGMTGRAISYLQKALSEGFTTPDQIASDSSFAALHSNPGYEHLVTQQEK